MINKYAHKKGFTLLELLVVVAIIGVLAAIIMASVGDARKKGGDAGVRSNLIAARSQAEVFYNTNSVANLTYTGVCGIAAVGTPPVQPVGPMVLAAAKAVGLTTYGINVAGSTTTATCNVPTTNASAWAAEVPLKEGGMWCVDSTNKSLKTVGSSLSGGTDYTCN